MPHLKGLVVVRVAVAVILGIHGVYRALAGGVAPFGEFLSSRGFPLGTGLAWAITLFEIAACVPLALGRGLRVVAPGYALILVCGIALVHGPNGWFVVGAGRNGIEFSVLLLACLAAVLLESESRPSGPAS
jgi:putative oxidoreductase